MDKGHKLQDQEILPTATDNSETVNQLPEWHPFAVWQTQIQDERTRKAVKQQPTLRSVKIADAHT